MLGKDVSHQYCERVNLVEYDVPLRTLLNRHIENGLNGYIIETREAALAKHLRAVFCKARNLPWLFKVLNTMITLFAGAIGSASDEQLVRVIERRVRNRFPLLRDGQVQAHSAIMCFSEPLHSRGNDGLSNVAVVLDGTVTWSVHCQG